MAIACGNPADLPSPRHAHRRAPRRNRWPRPVYATDPLGNPTKLAYNPAGQLLSVIDPLNNVGQFSYDLGDLIAVTDPLGRVNKKLLTLWAALKNE